MLCQMKYSKVCGRWSGGVDEELSALGGGRETQRAHQRPKGCRSVGRQDIAGVMECENKLQKATRIMPGCIQKCSAEAPQDGPTCAPRERRGGN